jgi:hypothetical protein
MPATVLIALPPGPPGLMKRCPILSAVLLAGLSSLTMPSRKVSPCGASQSTGTVKFAHWRFDGSELGQVLQEMVDRGVYVEMGIVQTGAASSAMLRSRDDIFCLMFGDSAELNGADWLSRTGQVRRN